MGLAMDFGTRHLARPLLAYLLLAMSACVLPQGDNTLTTPVPFQNRPPRFIEESRSINANSSTNRLVKANASATCTIKFSVQNAIDDPDWCDALQVQWYVDYQDTNPDPATIKRSIPVASPPDPSTARDFSSTDFTLQTANFANPLFSPLPEFGAHVVEALVTDGTVTVNTTTGRTTPARRFLQPCFPPVVTVLPDGGVPSDPTFFATYAWTVVIDSAAPCPSSVSH
jgi:hypothetical protein